MTEAEFQKLWLIVAKVRPERDLGAKTARMATDALIVTLLNAGVNKHRIRALAQCSYARVAKWSRTLKESGWQRPDRSSKSSKKSTKTSTPR